MAPLVEIEKSKHLPRYIGFGKVKWYNYLLARKVVKASYTLHIGLLTYIECDNDKV